MKKFIHALRIIGLGVSVGVLMVVFGMVLPEQYFVRYGTLIVIILIVFAILAEIVFYTAAGRAIRTRLKGQSAQAAHEKFKDTINTKI